MWRWGKFFQKSIPFAYASVLLFGLASQAHSDEPKEQPTPDIESRILLLDRVYNRFIKAVAPSEANPLRWPEDWWVGLGTEAEWTEAVHEWFKRNPRLTKDAQKGRENRGAYAGAIYQSSLSYNRYFGAQTDAADKVYSSFLQFVGSQRRLMEQDRDPIDAEVLARDETLKWISKLSRERRLPFERWREDPLIWEYYRKRKARHEFDTVQKETKNTRRVAFENWRQQQLTAVYAAINANLKV